MLLTLRVLIPGTSWLIADMSSVLVPVYEALVTYNAGMLLATQGDTHMKPTPAVPMNAVPRMKPDVLNDSGAGSVGMHAPLAAMLNGLAIARAYLSAHLDNIVSNCFFSGLEGAFCDVGR